MEVVFEDEALARLDREPDFLDGRPHEQVRAFRKVINLIRQATKSPDLYAFKSLRIEKLLGKMQGLHSLRLNDQYRLVVRFGHTGERETVTVLTIKDYH